MTAPPTKTADLTIDVRDVAKTYRGKVHALRGIDLHVGRGEVFGLLGPNGAGKTTLVKILMTVISPTRCAGHMLGQPIGHKPTLGRVGYLPEHHKFPEYLTGAQVLDFYGALAGVPRGERRRRREELLDLVQMREWSHKRVKSYSKGMRQRVGVAQALMSDPELVLLDEPTDGVDPVGRRDIRNIMHELSRRGKTVFINSHLLSELEMICSRVAILVQGVVASQGTIEHLTRDQERYEIDLVLEPGTDPARIVGPLVSGPFERTDGAGAVSGRLAGGELVEIDRGMLRVGTADARRIQPIVDALRRQGVVIRSMKPVRPSLEDLFMQAVTDPNTGEVLMPGAAKGGKP